MPKLKTNRSTAKRFKKVAGGKSYKHRSTNRNHILTKKTTKRKRGLRSNTLVSESDLRSVKRLLNDM